MDSQGSQSRPQSLRILIVSTFPPALGTSAGAARVFEVARGVSRHHTVDILSFIDTVDDRKHISALKVFCRSVDTILRTRTPLAGDLLGMQPTQFVTEYSDSTMAQEIQQRVSSGRYDLVQFEFLQTAWLMPKDCPIPSLLTHHEVQHAVCIQRMNLSKTLIERASHFINWMRVLHWELEICSRFSAVITVTPDDAARISKYLSRPKIRVNRTGVDCAHYAPMDVIPLSNRLVFMGYYGHSPNVDAAEWLVREIMPLVWLRRPDVHVDLVGGGVIPKMHGLATDSRVHITGWVEDYRPFVARAIPLVPIRLGYGIRHKVLEAWAMGRPVISTALGSAGTGAINGTNACIADSAPDFANAIINLLDNRELQSQLGRNGRTHVLRNFDWPIIFGEHEDIYNNIMNEWRHGEHRP
ncbi:MAG: glycosyltransferase [Actinobacteria bacterium]|uniref:Unannotated protein n=1 Tax=freshwater metagenome TaxID=449393 RepID=A0A6J6WX00_9ZZZZ|nr:glycosyltransferase [Actinomycetota bacterium]